MGPLGAPVAARYGEEAIQERVLRVPGLEAGRGPEVVGRGVDALAARERRDHFRRAVTKPEGRHVDEGAVVGLECDAQVELEDAVGSEERPIAATGQHLAAKPRALEVAARDWRRDASAVRHCADPSVRRPPRPATSSGNVSSFGDSRPNRPRLTLM